MTSIVSGRKRTGVSNMTTIAPPQGTHRCPPYRASMAYHCRLSYSRRTRIYACVRQRTCLSTLGAKVQDRKKEERDSPDTRHVLAHLVCICALQLEQLCISLDFEKDFVPCRADDLRASASIRESCICEGVNGCKQVCG